MPAIGPTTGGPALAATVLALAGVRRGGRILDVGAGSLLYARPAAAAATATGLVVSCDDLESIAHGTSRGPASWAPILRVAAVPGGLPVHDASFHTVICAPAGPSGPRLADVVEELRRVALPGARVVVSATAATAPSDAALLAAAGLEIVHLAESAWSGALVCHIVARPAA
ncbi:MAG TPA: hypothetical protein VNA12_03470 [Mycobacteriales bacterium]|nr:hypothetical protein [Mycobacteriales bacterium]